MLLVQLWMRPITSKWISGQVFSNPYIRRFSSRSSRIEGCRCPHRFDAGCVRGVKLDQGYRADLIVADVVIVEPKSVEAVLPVHRKQLLTYLRLADKRLGLLLNFGAELMKEGIFTVVNGMKG